MKHPVVKTLAIFSMILWCTVAAFAQGVFWQTKTTGSVGEYTSDSYAMPKKMKMVNSGAVGTMIIRLDKEVIWNLNPAKKTYTEVTFAQAEQLAKKAGGKMDDAMSKMQERMKDMPEEQRKMVEKMMGSRMGGGTDEQVRVQKTSEGKTISGFATTKYIVKKGDEDFMTLWVTRDAPGFAELREDWKAFSARMAAMVPRFGKGMAEAYKNIDGFTIQTEMGHGVVTTVTKIERRSVPASEFEIPSGFTKVRGEMENAAEQMDSEEN